MNVVEKISNSLKTSNSSSNNNMNFMNKYKTTKKVINYLNNMKCNEFLKNIQPLPNIYLKLINFIIII